MCSSSSRSALDRWALNCKGALRVYIRFLLTDHFRLWAETGQVKWTFINSTTSIPLIILELEIGQCIWQSLAFLLHTYLYCTARNSTFLQDLNSFSPSSIAKLKSKYLMFHLFINHFPTSFTLQQSTVIIFNPLLRLYGPCQI